MTSSIAARALYETVCAVTAPPGVDYEKLPRGVSLKVVEHEATPGMPTDTILCFDHRECLAYPLEAAEVFLVHSHARQLRQLALDHGLTLPSTSEQCCAAPSSSSAAERCDGGGPTLVPAAHPRAGEYKDIPLRRAPLHDTTTERDTSMPSRKTYRAPSERDAQRDFEETGF